MSFSCAKRFQGIAMALFGAMVALTMPGCSPYGAPDIYGERLAAAQEEMDAWGDGNLSPQAGFSVEAAIEYALQNNLSVRAAELEYAIEQEAKTGAALKMLPSLNANLNATNRSRYNASSSQSLATGSESLISSYSRERFTAPMDVSLAWSIVDFGLSYVRARQALDRELMAQQNLRRLRQQIAMDTFIAYYRLRAAEDIMRECAPLEDAIKLQLSIIQDGARERNFSKTEEARRSMPLLIGLRTLGEFTKERQSALLALAKAMGVPRPRDIEIGQEDGDWTAKLPEIDLDRPEELMEKALAFRPELYRADSEARISRLDARAALLQMAPNVTLSASLNHDEDRFLAYHNWTEAAFRVSWDLLRLPAKYRDAKTAEQRAELTALRKRVTAASIMIQVNLALVEFAEQGERMELLDRIEANRRVIVEGMEDNLATGKGHAGDLLGEKLRHITDYSNKYWAKSSYMAAYARLVCAMGLDGGLSGGIPADQRSFTSSMALAVPAVAAETETHIVSVIDLN